MTDEARRLASIVDPLGELEELIESVCYVIDRFEDLADSRLRLMRAAEAALPLVRRLVDAARDDLEELFFECLEEPEP
jgi:hypothetical protein